MFPEPTFLFVFDSAEDEDIKMVKKALPNLLGVLQGENNALQREHPAAGREAQRKVKDTAAFVCSDKKQQLLRKYKRKTKEGERGKLERKEKETL